MPELGESSSLRIAITTTVEIKRGMYEMVCTTFLNFFARTSLSRIAKMMGIGKLITKLETEVITVLRSALQKAGSFKKRSQ